MEAAPVAPVAPVAPAATFSTTSSATSSVAGGRFVGGAAVSTPPWLRGEMEAPAGVKDMGGWTRGVFTAEQQARLGVDENGQKVEVAASSPNASGVKALPPPWLTGQMEAPAGTKDMGGWTKAVFTAEQQARLGVNEEGQKLTKNGAITVVASGQSDADWLHENAFRNFDVDSSGAVSVDEFLDFANDMEGTGKMTKTQVKIMFGICDKNGDGELQLDEFKEMMYGVLEQSDPNARVSDSWHEFYCENFLTGRQAREFRARKK